MIRFIDEHHNWGGDKKPKTKIWLNKIAALEDKKIKKLNYLIVNNEEIHIINNKFLNGDYFTDIISFDYSNESFLIGEIYISYEMIAHNSQKFHVKPLDEWNRVLAHGLLHLMGYKDKTKSEIVRMRKKEDFCLALFNEIASSC